MAAEHEARAVRVGQQDHAPRLRQTAEIRRLLPVVEQGEAAHLHHSGIHYLQERISVVPPLYYDDFPDPRLHFTPASSMRNSFSSPSLSMFRSLFMR